MILLFLLLCLPIAFCTGDDLQFPGCPGRDRCSAMFDTAAADFRLRNCECDSDCVDFGDCCEDYPRDTRRKNHDRPMRCVGFGTGPAGLGVYMAVGCPAGADPHLRAECEANHEPVIVFPDGPTYQNEHCAACNGHALNSLIHWELIVDCEGPALSSTYIRQNLKQADDGGWEVEFESKTYVCDVLFNFSTAASSKVAGRHSNYKLSDLFTLNISEVARRGPKYNLTDLFAPKNSVVAWRALRTLGALRLCRADLISECPPEWSGERVREACGGYAAVVHGSSRAYRNPHCALCNGEDVRSLVCDRSELDMGRRKEFSFAHLFDVRGEGDVGRKTGRCTKDQKLDPVSLTCRNLVCAIPGYVRINNKCVEKSR